jgi:hypothetical protein
MSFSLEDLAARSLEAARLRVAFETRRLQSEVARAVLDYLTDRVKKMQELK